MSDSSVEEHGDANMEEEDFDFNPNKRQSEKKRREQENLYLEELSQLISANFPELRHNQDFSLMQSLLVVRYLVESGPFSRMCTGTFLYRIQI
jgi:hypothetical protein